MESKKEIRVRFTPSDSEETFMGTIIGEKQHYYLVIQDNKLGSVRWAKSHCEIIE